MGKIEMACSFMCSEIYDALMRCCWQILLVKPSSTNKQGLSQSLSYSGSPVVQRENLRPMDPGEDEAAAKRVDEVYQDLLSLYTVQFISNK